MRILFVQISDHLRGGGGSIAMYRLHLGLKKAGFDSKILCGIKTLDSSDSVAGPRLSRLERYLGKVTSGLGLNDIHRISSFKIPKSKAYLEADIINFHGFRKYFNYLALPALTKNKPGVFTLQDIWPFTGHCAISYDCDRWKIGCGKCPYPDVIPSIRRDNTRLEWKLKDWVYGRSNLVIVTLCSQVTEQAKQSMLNRFPIYQIPSGIDTKVYEPLDPEQCRSLLGIPPGKKVLMFAALNLSHYWKGGDLLLKALQGLPESLKAETVLLLLGDKGEAIVQTVGIQAINLGYIINDRVKAIAYSAADLFISPTRAEAFGLVIQESIACGTPVVACGVGGVLDLVRPGITGYLAEPENAQDLRNGIVQLLEDGPLRSHMGQQCRAVVLKEYDLELQVQRYVDLYRQILQT
ncbi:MAG: glycosyl transferase [Anaerolineae bacterium SM23_84]|nr:MAG: glycosyl transferase [Anaerolineae bacterium SM23_84]